MKNNDDFPLKIEPHTCTINGIEYINTIKKNNGKSIPINQYSLDGSLINTWRSIAFASTNTGYSTYYIKQCCQGAIPSLDGNIFKYAI